MKKVIHLIVGARPNFMKAAPLYHALRKTDWAEPVIVHTGQHSDYAMSEVFFHKLGVLPHYRLFREGELPAPRVLQTAEIMKEYANLCGAVRRPDAAIVMGDVNSTLACALAAKQMGLPLVHLEAGLRSFDRSMPEELNRTLVDHMADLLWTSEQSADLNLNSEGLRQWAHRIGNIMIDAFEMCRTAIESVPARPEKYILATIHRPSNTDSFTQLSRVIRGLRQAAEVMPVLWPMHPRTRARISEFNLWEDLIPIRLMPPLDYLEFMALVKNAALVVTDSGGVQEETTYLGVPCVTLRENTERPSTLEGTNRLASPAQLESWAHIAKEGSWTRGKVPYLWDGHAADRAVASLAKFLGAA